MLAESSCNAILGLFSPTGSISIYLFTIAQSSALSPESGKESIMSENTNSNIVPASNGANLAANQGQLAFDFKAIFSAIGKRTIMHTTSESHGLHYVSLRLVMHEDTARIMTRENGSTVWVKPHEVTRTTALVFEVQTMAYGRSNRFDTVVGTLESRYVEHKSQRFFAVCAPSGLSWLASKRESGVETYYSVTRPTFFDTAHIEQSLVSMLKFWLDKLSKGTFGNEDKRQAIVGAKGTAYLGYLMQSGKSDSSMKKYSAVELSAMLKAFENPNALPEQAQG